MVLNKQNIVPTIIAFIIIFNPSLKFIYRSEILNILPFLLFIVFVLFNFKEIKIRSYNLIDIIMISLFVLLYISMFFSDYLEPIYIIKLSILLLSYICGSILYFHIDIRLMFKLSILWSILLVVGYLFGIVKFGGESQFNYLNFVLPLAITVSGTMFVLMSKYNLTLKQYFFYTLLSILLMYFILTSGSRAAIILPFISMFVFILFYYKSISKIKLIFVISLFVFGLFLSFDYIYSNLSQTFINKTFNSNITHDSRYILYSNVINYIIDNPFGIGFYNFLNYIDKPYPHNIFLEISSNAGVLSALIFMVLLALLFIFLKINKTFIGYEVFIIWMIYLILAWNLSNSFLSSMPLFFIIGVISSRIKDYNSI